MIFNFFNNNKNDVFKEYNNTRSFKSKHFCNAPFKSLTFFLDGDVMACWQNKQYLLGKYPKNSIKDIWFGERAEKLRKNILKNDLSLGCEECKKKLTKKDFKNIPAKKYDYLTIYKNKDFPVSIDFQISNICNFECIMCNGEYSISVRQHREMLEPYNNPYDTNFISQLETFIPYIREASFSGGETFIIDFYYKIWEKIIELNPKVIISVTTNGSVLNDRVKNILDKLKFNITISIDSVNKQTYEYIRRNGKMENLLNNLEYFIEYTKTKNTFLTARVCPLKQNWKELPEILNFLNKKNIRTTFNTVLFPPYSSLWNLKSTELENISNHLKTSQIINENKIQNENYLNYYNIIYEIDKWTNEAVKREQNYPDIYNKNTNELKNVLFIKVNEFVNNSKSFSIPEKEKFISFFQTSINKCVNEIPNVNNALIYFILFPTNRLIDEFNIRTNEKILSLMLQASKTEF